MDMRLTERWVTLSFPCIGSDGSKILLKVRAVSVEDNNSAVETVSREKATSSPGSVGAPMSGVVVEVRAKEGQEVMKGDPLCGMFFVNSKSPASSDLCLLLSFSPQRHEGQSSYWKGIVWERV